MLIANCEVVELSPEMFIRENNKLKNLIIENINDLTVNNLSLAFQNPATVILLHVKKIRFR